MQDDIFGVLALLKPIIKTSTYMFVWLKAPNKVKMRRT